MDTSIILKRIEELKKERELYLATANAQVIAYGAVISELERILKTIDSQGATTPPEGAPKAAPSS